MARVSAEETVEVSEEGELEEARLAQMKVEEDTNEQSAAEEAAAVEAMKRAEEEAQLKAKAEEVCGRTESK